MNLSRFRIRRSAVFVPITLKFLRPLHRSELQIGFRADDGSTALGAKDLFGPNCPSYQGRSACGRLPSSTKRAAAGKRRPASISLPASLDSDTALCSWIWIRKVIAE